MKHICLLFLVDIDAKVSPSEKENTHPIVISESLASLYQKYMPDFMLSNNSIQMKECVFKSNSSSNQQHNGSTLFTGSTRHLGQFISWAAYVAQNLFKLQLPVWMICSLLLSCIRISKHGFNWGNYIIPSVLHN